MFQRKTQTESYWSEQYEITAHEVGRTYDLVLDAGRPVQASVLACALIEAACRREEAMIQAELSRGVPYRPMGSYQLGEQMTFPAFDYAWATVIGSRPARNPEHGEFVAIQVQFEGDERVREFASQLHGGHKLDRGPEEGGLLAAGAARSTDELCDLYGGVVEPKLAAALATHAEFVRFGDEWFLREFLVPVSIGQLNIAEALIEVKGMPLSTSDLLTDLDLPAEVPDQIRSLSLKRALLHSSR